ncbi:MAG: MBL fold metallo-hydrolase [Anaerolineaceae bacterium]|nr:MBL fold metallo-hydrolase [Anaerolineaceae bacterium]
MLEVNGKRLLIDCGMYQGKRAEMYSRNRNFRFDPRNVDAVVLTHAHIDHSGNLPNLVKNGYEGSIYGTLASCDLADLMLRDSAHIQESDAEYVNKKRARKGEPPVEPIYTTEDAEKVVKQLIKKDYDEYFSPMPGVVLRLRDAGHILGSAAIEVEVDEGGNKRRLWFSGDIGRRNLHLLRDPILPEGEIDYLVMESTYGDKQHRDPLEAYEELLQVVKETIKKRGKVVVPAFAVGRTQELVYALNLFVSDKRMPAIPVYVDSPLAVNASDIFRRHPECYDRETRDFIKEHNHPALEFERLTYIRSVEASKALNRMPGPMIILSASGMAETGRILHHLKNNIEDSRNMILIVSWQAPYTLGRRLADRATRVRIFGEEYVRRAGVTTIGGLSGHAGQNLLVEYARSAAKGKQLKRIFLVHGEPEKARVLQSRLSEAGLPQTYYPEMSESVEL